MKEKNYADVVNSYIGNIKDNFEYKRHPENYYFLINLGHTFGIAKSKVIKELWSLIKIGTQILENNEQL